RRHRAGPPARAGDGREPRGPDAGPRDGVLPRLLLGWRELEPGLPAPGHRAARGRTLLESRDGFAAGRAALRSFQGEQLQPRSSALLDPDRGLFTLGILERAPHLDLRTVLDRDVLRHERRLAAAREH